MKLFPRHQKILDAIKRHGSCCPNLLWQASGVLSVERSCAELKNAGLIKWTTKRKWGTFFRNRPPGWKLTEKGKTYAN